MNPFKTFNQKSLDDPLPFTPEGFQGGGFVFNHKKNGLSKRTYMSRRPLRRWINAISFAVINVGIPLAIVVYCWYSYSADASLGTQLFLGGLSLVSLTWAWITLPYTIFFVRIIKQ